MSRDIVKKCGNLYSFLLCLFMLLSSFDFVKSSGTSIVPINMPEMQKMNGKILKHIAGNGPVYIRSNCSSYGIEVLYSLVILKNSHVFFFKKSITMPYIAYIYLFLCIFNSSPPKGVMQLECKWEGLRAIVINFVATSFHGHTLL